MDELQKIDSNVIANGGDTPWLTERGLPISDDELKVVSKTWPTEMWQKYLSWFETPRAESLLPPRQFDSQMERMDNSIFANSEGAADRSLYMQVAEVLAQLTPRQHRAIELTYWRGLSERQVAVELRITRDTVRDLKRRALKKIAAHLRGVPPTSRTMRGEVAPLSITAGGLDDKAVLELVSGAFPKAS
jgi:RNA polymerase sigma factor (sigma-70 family)